jgi:TonB family protein
MFDKLIVCEPEGADFKDRRSYFIVSSFVVGVVFLAAVVFSIYAADFGLGNENFELSMLMAPPEVAATEPEPPKPQTPAAQPAQSIKQEAVPIRQVNMPRVEEIDPIPTEVSTAPNDVQARPVGEFQIGATDTNVGPGTQSGPPSSGTAEVKVPVVVIPKPEPEPVIVKPDPPMPPPVRSGGVVNGIAKDLPTPAYPAIARQMNISGVVQVQVLIDEAGKVIAANAVSGHSIFKPAAEKAAWKARFGTTTLSGVPVKVSGVIVYNFKK